MNKTGNNRFDLQSKIAVNSANKYLGNFLVVPKVIGITNTPKAATSRQILTNTSHKFDGNKSQAKL